MTDDPKYSHESGYRPYCGRCNTMYRMKIMDFGWQCAHPRCANTIDKNGMRINLTDVPDTRPDYIQHNRTLLDSMIETRYSEVGPSNTGDVQKDIDENIRRIKEAGETLRSVAASQKGEAK